MANNEMNVLKIGNSEFTIADAQARQDVSELKEDFHEYHSELGAGYADQLVSGIETEDKTPYNFRAVGQDATLEYGEIVGVTVNLNSLARFSQTDIPSSGDGITYSYTDGNSVLINGTATANENRTGWFGLQESIGLNASRVGHKLMIYPLLVSGTVNGTVSFTLPIGITATLGSGKIGTLAYSSTNQVRASHTIANGTVCTNAKITILCTDLTAMFGTQIADRAYALETATAGSGVAWLKEHFPKIFDSGYVPYNAGTLVPVSGLSAHVTVGKNQINVNESESGGIDASGVEVTDPNNWRCTEYIPVIGGMEYVLSSQIETKRLYFYDESYNFISPRIQGSTPAISATAPINAKYARWTLYKGSLMTLDDVKNSKTQLEFGSTDTSYEPYVQHTYPLDSTIDLHGMLKLDSNNNLYADGDVYKPSGQVSYRYSITDLGTLDWSYESSSAYTRFYTTSLNSIIKKPASETVPFDVLCNRYVTVPVGGGGEVIFSNNGDKIVGIGASGTVSIRDLSYSDASAFKQAMSGVYLVYPLATPTTETAEPYNPNQICDPNGTEEFISTTVAPVGHVTRYPLDVAGRLDNILSMPTANGTYTLRAVVSNGTVTYSWVSA